MVIKALINGRISLIKHQHLHNSSLSKRTFQNISEEYNTVVSSLNLLFPSLKEQT